MARFTSKTARLAASDLAFYDQPDVIRAMQRGPLKRRANRAERQQARLDVKRALDDLAVERESA